MNTVTALKTLTIGATLAMASTLPLWAEAFPSSFADLADKVSPSVVRITTTVNGEQQPDFNIPEGEDMPDFMRKFLEQNPEMFQQFGQQGRSEPSTGLGSGYLINGGQYVVTNNHVVDGADEITVETVKGDKLDATLVGVDAKTDVAVLKIVNTTELPFVEYGDSDVARVGDWVMAIGHPLGEDFSVTTGIISARNRSLEGAYDDFLQTDAAINRGNSGGPLFNMDGQVIGMNTAILSPNGGSIGLGFAMSSNVVSKVVDQIIKFGETRRGWLGVAIGEMDADLAESIGLPNSQGVLVQGLNEVTENTPAGPAEVAGIKAGDVILKFDGVEVKDTKEFVKQVGNTEVNKKVEVEIYRPSEQKNQTILVTLGKLPQANAKTEQAKPVEAEKPKPTLGLSLVPLDKNAAAEYGFEKEGGLLITEVDPKSEAAKRGLEAGFVIREVNQVAVNSFADFEKEINAAKKLGRKSVFTLIENKGSAMFFALPIE